MTQIKGENKAGVLDALKQLLEGEVKMWKDYKGSSTLGTKSHAAQLSSKARRGLGSYRSPNHKQAVGTAGPKVFPVA